MTDQGNSQIPKWADRDAQELEERIDALARKVLTLAKNTLLLNLRFLDASVGRLQWMRYDAGGFCTDGMRLLYSPRLLLAQYRRHPALPVRNYLHLTLHCVFQHMYGAEGMHPKLWNLACDAAVEHAISELNLPALTTTADEEKEAVFAQWRQHAPLMTAEQIYHWLRKEPPELEQFEQLESLFGADIHDSWYWPELPKDLKTGMGAGEEDGGNGSGGDKRFDPDIKSSEEDLAQQRKREEQAWKEISERMLAELEGFFIKRGNQAGSLLQNLKEVNRERYDYREFLRNFMTFGEVMRLSPEEFDYVYYTYGLRLYGNMPLIEPLEYREIRSVRELVIAIDTSGSVAGELVQAFVQKTCDLLGSKESFFDGFNLHLIQCDAAVQEHVKLTTRKEFDDYLATMQLKGLGGTDFRPVFQLVDELIEAGEFTDLKGVLYLTDGYGTFPKRPPAYPAAFLFLKEDYEPPKVPPWAIRLVMQKEELLSALNGQDRGSRS